MPFAGLAQETQHAGPEVGRHEHALAAVPGLTVDPGEELFSKLLLKLGLEGLDLLGRFARDNLNDGLLVRPQTIHGILEVFAVLVVIQRSFGVRAFQHRQKDAFKVPAGLRLNVLNQISVEKPSVGLSDYCPLLERGTHDDADELVFRGAPSCHSTMKGRGAALSPCHGLILQQLFVIEGSFRLDVIYELPLVCLQIQAWLVVEKLELSCHRGLVDPCSISDKSVHNAVAVSNPETVDLIVEVLG